MADNQETPSLEPDILTPGSVAFLVDSRNDFVLQHGGSVTRVGFDRLEQMSVDHFLANEVGKLKAKDRSLTLLRDSVSGTYAVILGDQVLRYHVTSVEECPLDDVIRRLRTKDDLSLSFNIPYPMVSYVQSGGSEHVTIELPPTLRQFRSRIYNVDTALYLPPMWFRVSFNAAGAMHEAAIAVVPERSAVRRKTRLYRLPLPNNWDTGRICFGGVSFVAPGEGSKSLGERMQGALDMLFSSDWNSDLLHVPDMPTELMAAAMAIKDDRLANSTASRSFNGLLRLLGTPNGWQKIPYDNITVSAEEFTRCANL